MSKIYPLVLETERLILRPLTLDDVDSCFKWTSDPRVNKYMIYPLHRSTEDTAAWINMLYENENNIDYGFVLKETGALIGSGGIYKKENDEWMIGYNLSFDYWHHGYTTEAISKIIEYACTNFFVKAITGSFCVDNIGSCRVMEKLGLTYYKDCEYQKLDGSETFKSMLFRKEL